MDTLRASLEQQKGVLSIDLKDVLIVGQEAIKLLAVCESNGVELRNSPAYIREWVTRETADSRVGVGIEYRASKPNPQHSGS